MPPFKNMPAPSRSFFPVCGPRNGRQGLREPFRSRNTRKTTNGTLLSVFYCFSASSFRFGIFAERRPGNFPSGAGNQTAKFRLSAVGRRRYGGLTIRARGCALEKPELRQDGDFISSMELGQSSFARDAAVKLNPHPPALVEAVLQRASMPQAEAAASAASGSLMAIFVTSPGSRCEMSAGTDRTNAFP